MSWFLVMIPVLLVLGSILMYRFVGKGEIFRFDLVQFLYACILTPLAFVWGKVLLYLLVKNGLHTPTSDLNYLLMDSGYSLVFLYVFGFMMLHSLTKSVSLKLSRDPLYDIFNHLEYFHLWLTHLIVFGGGMLILTILGIINVFFPLDLEMADYLFYLFIGSGFFSGGLIFMGIWLSDPKQEEGHHFMRVMKILIGLLFTVHVIIYFLFEPKLEANELLFWWSSFNFTMMVFCVFLSHHPIKEKTWFRRWLDALKHTGWDFRAQIK